MKRGLLNGHTTGGTINWASGKTDRYSDYLFLSAPTTQIKVAIRSLEFQDGSTWNNPYFYEWLLANHNKY